MMSTDGITMLTILLVAAFAIERLTAGILFGLVLMQILPDPELSDDSTKRALANRKTTVFHFLISGVLVVIVLYYVRDFRFLDALGLGGRTDLSSVPSWLDHFLLGVVLLGGSEQMSAFLKMVGAPSGGDSKSASSQPVEISGKLTLEDPPGKK